MTSTDAFKGHLHRVLSDRARLRGWLDGIGRREDGLSNVIDPLSPSDVLTLGVLLARSCSSSADDGCDCGQTGIADVEDALRRAVSRLGPDLLHSAALLSAEAVTPSRSTKSDPTFMLWLREALPALLAWLLRSPSPKAWALAEESASLLTQQAFFNTDAYTARSNHGLSYSAVQKDTLGVRNIMPLLESLVRSANAASQAVAGTAGNLAGVRALAAALKAVPAVALASSGPWRLLLDIFLVQAYDELFESSSAVLLISTVGQALARAASADSDRRVELCSVIEQKLLGCIQARGIGLELLRAVLCAPEQPFSPPDVQLAVRWAIHAAASAKISTSFESMEMSQRAPGIQAQRLLVSSAAVVMAAAPYLSAVDLAAVRDRWLAPRLSAQSLTWRHNIQQVNDSRKTTPVCTVRKHVSIPVSERLHVDAAAALFHADLVLTAHVDPDEFKARIMDGGIELGLTPHQNIRKIDTSSGSCMKTPAPEANERWGYLMATAVMTILANLLQACLENEYHHCDIAHYNDVHKVALKGVSLGLTNSDVRRALMHRLSHLLALQRRIENKKACKKVNCGEQSNEDKMFAFSVKLLPRVQVSTWLSAVDRVLAEDEPQRPSFENDARFDMGYVEPQVQAGILSRAADAVSVAVGLKRNDVVGNVSNVNFILQDILGRGIIQKALRLAERLVPNVAVSSMDTAVSAGSFIGGHSNRYRMLLHRVSGTQKDGVLNPVEIVQNVGRWTEASANTRAAIVAGCFELCTAAAQAPASSAIKQAVTCALAAPVLQPEASDVRNTNDITDKCVLETGMTDLGNVNPNDLRLSERDDESSRRLAVIQWVTARATECIALRASVPALSLGATLLLTLPPAAATAWTPILVTAHASAALWGYTDGNTFDSDVLPENRLISNPLQSTQELFQEHVARAVGEAHHHEAHNRLYEMMKKSNFASLGELSLEFSQRVGLLQIGHYLTLRCNGADDAISMIADVIHVVSSSVDPVSSHAAAASIFVALHLLASHVHFAIDMARESALNQSIQSDEGSVIDSSLQDMITRLGRLIVKSIGAVVTMTNDSTDSKDKAAIQSGSWIHYGNQVLHGINAALLSLILSANWFRSTSSGNAIFDDILHAAYISSGRLGMAVQNCAQGDSLTEAQCEITNLKLHRVALRAAAALRGGERLTQNASFASWAGPAIVETRNKRVDGTFRRVHWVDMDAQEPSDGGETDDNEDDDDAIFCVHPNGMGISGWEMDLHEPATSDMVNDELLLR